MRAISSILILMFAITAFAGGDSKPVLLLSLSEIEEDVYRLEYKEIKTTNIVTVILEYNSWQYLAFTPLNDDKYAKSIALLKKQLALGQPTRFGSFGGGPCLVDKKKNIYRSDALDIFDENQSGKGQFVVYAFCEYQS